jgi:RNA polymerase sigma factor (sigma-70 family)
MVNNNGKNTDNELLIALKGDKKSSEKAFAEIYARYSFRVYAYCLRVMGTNEDAQDVFQETFLNFYNTSKTIEKVENMAGLLLKIARNICINNKRSKVSHLNIDDFSVLDNSSSMELENKELLHLIATALELLDFEFREAFVLRQYQGFSYKEISDITGVNISTVKNRVWRAKDKIKNILTPYLEDMSYNKIN